MYSHTHPARHTSHTQSHRLAAADMHTMHTLRHGHTCSQSSQRHIRTHRNIGQRNAHSTTVTRGHTHTGSGSNLVNSLDDYTGGTVRKAYSVGCPHQDPPSPSARCPKVHPTDPRVQVLPEPPVPTGTCRAQQDCKVGHTHPFNRHPDLSPTIRNPRRTHCASCQTWLWPQGPRSQ